MAIFCPESIETLVPPLPPSLQNRIYLLSTCDLSPAEILVFTQAFAVFSIVLESDASVNPNIWANVVIMDRDTISLTLDNPADRGVHAPMILLPIHRWRAAKYNALGMYACIFEELCHHFWCIRDEIAVKKKVFSIIQIIYPNLQFSDLYNPNWF